MIMNLQFLSCIKEPLICSIDGKNVKFENGTAAEDFYKSENGKYEAKDITVEDGMIKITIADMTDEINARNQKWMEEVKERTGQEPSFF